jgi:hypothetical protein
MTWSADEREVALAIEAVDPSAEVTGSGWRLRLGPGARAPRIGAFVDDAWLLLDEPLESGVLSNASLATANGGLPGGAKFALVPEDERIHVRAELPLQLGTDLAARLLEALRGCERAIALARGKCELEGVALPGAGDPGGDAAVAPASEDDLSRLCEETGWVFNRRSSGFPTVDLEGTRGFFQGRLERRAGGVVSLSAEIQDCDAATSACEEALAVFLLRSCGLQRMARAVGAPTGERVAPRFEVILAADPSPAELSEALSALSVAVRFGAGELQVLARSEEVALSYLAHQPRPRRPAAAARKRVRRSTRATEASAKGQAAVPRM